MEGGRRRVESATSSVGLVGGWEPKRGICVVTGSRADYGILQPVLRRIVDDPAFELKLVVTGSHLSRAHGFTRDEVVADGFRIAEEVPLDLETDDAEAICRAMGDAVRGLAAAIGRSRPDILLLLGDRFEIFAAAQAALVLRVPVAHIGGGDVTEGAFDESLRHSITKMAHLHFVTHPAAARRVRQLGENPAHVFLTGSPAIDRILSLPLVDDRTIFRELGLVPASKTLLVTYHPETLSDSSPGRDFEELLAALDMIHEGLQGDLGVILTLPNADPGGRAIADEIASFESKRPWARSFASLGHVRYLSLMRASDVIVGNSSSGLHEAPSFGRPTVDIGGRQKGRLAGESVIRCAAERGAIRDSIRKAFGMPRDDVRNPYGDGKAAQAIVAELKGVADPRSLLRKRFWEYVG